MDKESADAINAGFEQVNAENFAVLRLLGMLFAASPPAMAHLEAMDAQALQAMLEGRPFSDAFIARALETTEVVRTLARRNRQVHRPPE